ncbi:hypothetical protein LTR93_012290, partial [Exophiala xenobiotica]
MNNGIRSGAEAVEATPGGRPRTMKEEEKYEKILSDMTHKYRVAFDELLEYIITYRHNKTVMQRFGSLKRCISKMAKLQDTVKLEEWQQVFDGGLWEVVAQLLRKEILMAATVEEVCADVEDIGDRNRKQDDPIIPVDGSKESAPQTVKLLHEICQPRERLQRRRPETTELRVSYIVTLLCALQQPNTCQAIPLQ